MKNIIFDIFGVLFDYKDGHIFQDSQANPFKPIEHGHKLLRKCFNDKKKKNLKLFILSNCEKEFFAILNKHYPEVFKLFDGIVVSANSGFKKPDREIYDHLINTYNLLAYDCLFIDDKHENVTVAQKLGMTGVLFNSSNLEDEIKSFLASVTH